MSTYNICFCREIRKILFGYPLLSVAMSNEYYSKFSWRNKKNRTTFSLKKAPYLELCKYHIHVLVVNHSYR